jgi:acyl-CoA synthetase (AMP-forming)/AMP-acid ligase II
MSVSLKEFLEASDPDILTEATNYKKLVKNIEQAESRFRLTMWDLVQALSKEFDSTQANKVSRSYKQYVTRFMMDLMKLMKRMK